jgi:hypothetical protein
VQRRKRGSELSRKVRAVVGGFGDRLEELADVPTQILYAGELDEAVRDVQ